MFSKAFFFKVIKSRDCVGRVNKFLYLKSNFAKIYPEIIKYVKNVFLCPLVQTSFTSKNLKEILTWVTMFCTKCIAFPKSVRFLHLERFCLYDHQIRYCQISCIFLYPFYAPDVKFRHITVLPLISVPGGGGINFPKRGGGL